MKRITIHQENSEPLILHDNDKSALLEYTEKISEILNSSKICILETDSKVVSLKPSKLNLILVEEIEEQDNKIKEKTDIIKDS